MMWFMFLSWAMWLPVLGILFAVGVVLVLRSVSAPGWMRRGAACGGCGYELVAMGEERCPECGASLLRVGVSTPRMAVRLRGSGFLLVCGWTLVAVIGSMPVVGVAGSMAATAQMNQMMGAGGGGASTGTIDDMLRPSQMSSTGNLGTRDPESYRIALHADLTTDATSSVAAGTLTLDFRGAGADVSVEIDLADLSWSLTNASGDEIDGGAAFDADASARVYQAAGLDMDRASTSEESAYLSEYVLDLVSDPQGFANFPASWDKPLASQGASTGWRPAGLGASGAGGFPLWGVVMAAGLGLGGLVYIVGLVLLVRKRNRMLRAPVVAS